jgi:hypothetical protein
MWWFEESSKDINLLNNMNKEKFKVIATKVSTFVKERIGRICKKRGLNEYDMLQMMCECLIRFMDEEHNISEEMMKVIRMFENLPGWKTTVRLTEDFEKVQVVEAFYVIRRKGKTGSRLVHVVRPTMENDAEGWQCNYNTVQQLERFMELTNESLYKHLRCLSTDLGTVSLLDTIHTIANLYRENPDEGELRLQFESNDWVKGAQAHRDTAFKRRNSHSMAYIEKKDMGSLFDGQDTNE